MSSVFAPRRNRSQWTFIACAAALILLARAHPAQASRPWGAIVRPEAISPPAGATVYEAQAQFAWRAAPGARRHYLLISRSPFDARGWTSLPAAGGAIEVREVAHPIVSLDQLGIRIEKTQSLYWAGASINDAGRLSVSDVSACVALPRFANRVEASPNLVASPIMTTSSHASGSHAIHLRAGYTIEPRRGEPALPEALRSGSLSSNAKRTYLVYYGDADPEQTRKSLLASGALVVAYVPDHSFLVRADAATRVSAESADSWVGSFQPAYKLSPRLGTESAGVVTVNVLVFPDGDLDRVGAQAQSLGASIETMSNNGINKIVRLSLPSAAIAALAQDPDVAWIEPFVAPHTYNTLDQWVVQTGVTNSRRLWDMGIHGEGQVLMTSDSGVDTGHDMFRDAALPITTFGQYPTHRKIIAYERGSGSPAIAFGDETGASYHGTHTAGTVCGNDDGIGISTSDGMAKGAKLYFMDMGGPSLGNFLATPADLNDLYQPSYTGNGGGAARISSNSWGSDVGGAYDLASQQVDQFMWNHPDYLIFFANGNAGGVGTVGSPATSKSAVSVGATSNGNQENTYATFTSRGPTTDGRQKPTILAPGVNIQSAYIAPNNYQSLSGTSMATPSAAGCTALLRQYCTEGWYPTGAKVPANAFTPSAALLKSMVVNSGVNTMSVSGVLDNAPDNNVGWGRINADSVLYFSGDARRLLLVDQTGGLGDGQFIEYQVNVTDGSIPLEVSLCWTDYPGSPAALTQLVNDLDLEVVNGASTYVGNHYNNGVSTTGGPADHLNVEENVRVAAPATGVWMIRVRGTSVPIGPQAFGLTITGGVGTSAGVLSFDRASYGSASTVQLKVTDGNAVSPLHVTLISDSEPAGEDVTLTGSNGILTGSIQLQPYLSATGDGRVQVSNGDLITATYHDASPVATLVAYANISLSAPVITNVRASNHGTSDALVTWTTDESSSSRVYYGATPALGASTTLDPTATQSHQVEITGLVAEQTYYYDVESTDLEGNVTRDDHGGAHYQFTVQPHGDLLLVYGGPEFERPNRYANALGDLGWLYDTWEGPLSANPSVGNLATGMRSYKAVWWQNGLENYPPFSAAARDSITAYLDGGGRMVSLGHDVAWSLGDASSPDHDANTQAWLHNTLHTDFVNDTPGWTSIGGVAADSISGAYAGGIPYAEHRSGASGDEIAGSAGDGVLNYVWKSGDGSPDNCGFRWESLNAKGVAGTAVWGGKTSRLVTMYFEWSGLTPTQTSTSATRDDVMKKTLLWLLGRERPTVTVVAPNGNGTITTNSTSISWTESTSGGTNIASRKIEYSLDGGDSWITIATGVGASPYTWDLTSVPNTLRALVRVTVTDDGSPSFSGSDRSDATFSIQRSGGDLTGPAVVAGSILPDPDPISTQSAATLAATVSDSLGGGSNVTAAEWSIGAAPAAAGSGTAMTGAFNAVRVNVSASLPTGSFAPGQQKIWVRGRDAAGNWGGASYSTIVVNGTVPTAVTPRPTVLALMQNVPNPLHGTTLIPFSLPAQGAVELTIFDVMGRRVRSLVHGLEAAGVHNASWDRRDEDGHAVSPGLYFYRLTTAGRELQRRMVVLQ
jgi:hypothetical protein